VHDIDVGEAVEHGAAEMRGGADTRRGAVELARLRAGGLHHVIERLERERGVGDENERQRANLGRRLEVAQEQHRKVGTQRLVDGVGAGGEQHSVAVWLRPCDAAQASDSFCPNSRAMVSGPGPTTMNTGRVG
jgi:hypothetical protein